MELQNTSPNLTSRESVQKKIANALDYLGENYNIVDKSVREGDATTMDIARSFTGDVKSDKLSENIGLLDFTPLGTYFAAEEGQDAIDKAEPNALKKQMALLNYLRQPLQTIIDRPDIGLPATDIALGGIEAIPFGYVVTKPIKGFFKSLKAKATEPSKDVGMITQQTSLPISGDVPTTTKPVKNEEIDVSRRKFFGDVGKIGGATIVGGALSALPISKMVKQRIKETVKETPSVVENITNLADLDTNSFINTITDIAFKDNYIPIGAKSEELNKLKSSIDKLKKDGDPTTARLREMQYKKILTDELVEKDMVDFLKAHNSDFKQRPNRDETIGDLINKTDGFEVDDYVDIPTYNNLENTLTGKYYMLEKDVDEIDSIDDVVDWAESYVSDSRYFQEP